MKSSLNGIAVLLRQAGLDVSRACLMLKPEDFAKVCDAYEVATDTHSGLAVKTPAGRLFVREKATR